MAAEPGKGDAGTIDPDVAAFALWLRAEERKERDARKAAKAERAEADAHQGLVQAKEAAAADVKRLRGDSRATAEQRAAADEAYRVALAALVAAESGETPAWAPPPSAPDDASPTGETTADEPTAEETATDDDPSELGDALAEPEPTPAPEPTPEPDPEPEPEPAAEPDPEATEPEGAPGQEPAGQ